MNLADIATPAFALDQGKFQRNCARMIEKCRSLGVGLRPHMKTLKAIEAARVAIDPAHGGIAVSTLREAEYFAAEGIEDIQYAICITPDKLPRAARLMRKAPRFGFFLDSLDAAEAVAAFAKAEQVPLRAWIEIDSGDHRTGLEPSDDRILRIAALLAASPAMLAGVATHGGHSYGAPDTDGIAAIAEEERLGVVEAADRLRQAGFEVPGVSAGSTPTAVHMRSAEGLTEIRAGVYMAGDLFQAGIGSHGVEDIAASVVATVISHKPERNQIVVDAGGLALSKDRATSALADDMGYGLVTDLEGSPAFGRLIVAGVHQEHGEIQGEDPLPFDRLPIGSRVRILPNHVCMTAAAHDRYLVTAGSEVRGEWDKVGGW
ncbi:MAG TPA: alanine racemase [Allosphingosinicella sp.]|jgi:D-serine deaminase-like pyridoxal phosphate-dependent protein